LAKTTTRGLTVGDLCGHLVLGDNQVIADGWQDVVAAGGAAISGGSG